MSLGTANSWNSSVPFKQIPLCMEKPWVVCQGRPFLCKHWGCSWSSKARQLSIKPHTRTIFFSVTWNGEITKKSNTAPPILGLNHCHYKSDRELQWTGVASITTRSPGWHFKSRWKVLALLPPVHFSCSGDRRVARVSCLNHGHFEALNFQLFCLAMKHWVFSLSKP